jgi:hypothetical protein
MIDEIIFSPGKRTKVVNRSVKQDLQCPYGSVLVGANQVKALPGLFIHPLESYSVGTIIGLFSGRAYDVHPGEDIWVNLNFQVAPEENRKLMAELPPHPMMSSFSSPNKLSALFTRFGQVAVSGDNVKLAGTRYSAVNFASQ